MESYAFGKRGTFVDTDEGDNSLFIAYVMGEFAVGQDNGFVCCDMIRTYNLR